MPQLTAEHTTLVGQESAPRPAPYPINEAMARFWREMVEDPNPIYFDEAYARNTWLNEPFAPPAMLFTWGMQPVWPEEDRHESMISRLKLPGCSATLAVNATQEYHLPLRYGDRLTITNQIASIGEEKTTRLGTGHFVVMLDTFRNQRSEVAGTHSFTLFMYGPTKEERSKEPGARSQEPGREEAAKQLSSIRLPLTLRRAAQAV
ncbi:MAG: FAS1-like dehydratase domain-containing protein, partial [Burkholderiales bacterium]